MKPVLSSDAVRILGSDVIDLLHQHFHGYTTSVMTYAQFTRACATFGFVTTTSLQKAYRRHSCGAGLTFDDFLASVCSLEGSSQSRPWASPQVAKALRDRCMRGRVGAATSINASAQRLRAAFKQPGGVTHFSSALDDFERRCKRLSSGAQTSKGPHVTNNRRRNLVSSPFVQAVFKTASVPLKRMWTEFCGSGHTVSSRRGFMTCDKWVKVAGFLGIPYAEARDVFDQGQHGAQKEESKMSYDGFQAALCYWCQKQCPPQLGEGSDVSCARRLRKLLLEDVDVRSIQLSHRIHTYLHPDPITDLLRVSAHAVAEPRTHAAELATKIAEVEDREVAVHAMELVRVLETEGDVQGAYETLVAHAMTVKPKSAAAHFAPLLRKNPQQQPSRIPAPKSTVSSVKKSRPLGVTSSAVRDKNVRPHVKAPPSSAISGRPPLPPPRMKQATVAPAAVKNGTNGPSPSDKPHPVRIPPPLDEMTATPTARAARESIPGLTPVSAVNTPSSMACSWHLPTPTAQVAVRDSVHDLRDSVNELKLAIERQDEVLACELLECIAEQAAGMARETDACGSVDTPLVQSLSPVALDCASPSSQHYTSPSKHSGGSPSAHSSAHTGVNSATRMSVRASVSESLGNDCGRSVSSGLSEEVHTVASSPHMRGSVKVEIMSSPRSQKSVDCALLGEDIGHASHRGSVRATRSADGPQKGHLCSPTENTSVSVRVQECESVLRHSSPEQRSPPSPALISSFGPSVSVSQAASRAKEGLAITSPSSISCPVMRNNDEYEDTRPVHQRTAEDVLVHPSSPSTDAARQREQLDAANAAVQHAGTKDDVAAPSPFSPPGRRQPDECASARSSLRQSIIVADTSSPLERSLSGKKENVSKLLESLSKEADATPRSVECTSNSSQHSARSNAQDEPDNAHHVHDGEQGVAPYADAGVMQEDAVTRMRGWKTDVEECEERIRRRSSCSVNPEPFDKSAEDLYDKSSSEGDSKHAIAMSRWEIDSVKMGWASLRADMQRALDCAWQERSSRLSVMHIEYVVDWDAMTLGKANGAPPRRLRRIMTDSDPLDVSFDVAKASDDLKGHVDGERNANDNVSDDTIEDDMNFTLEPVHIPALRAALGTLRSYRYDPEAGQDVAKWLNHKGIGFITPDAGGDDLLVHFSAIKGEGDAFRSLANGAKVAYNTKPDPKDESKNVAVDVTGLDGGPPETKGKGRGWYIEDDDDNKPRTRPTQGKIGRVVKWLNHKGIGFIEPEGGGNDLMVHFSDIYADSDDKFRSLAEGARVEYDTKPDPKNESNFLATNVTAVGGGEPRQKSKGKGKGKGQGKGKGKDGKGK